MSAIEDSTAPRSGSPIRQNTVSRMISGGSAGLRMMIAFPRRAPPTVSMAGGVVSVNSSMFAGVPGPADTEAIDATISAYTTSATRETAATIGMVACPPQVTMLMFGASRCSPRWTAGTTNGPIAAGVRSTSRLPNGASLAALVTCALADVASNTTPISSNPARAISPSTPSAVVGTFSRAARASPSEDGSMPTTAPISKFRDSRITLIIRSVPILPDPITATFVRRMLVSLPRESHADATQSGQLRRDLSAWLGRHHRPERARENDITGAQRRPERRRGTGQPYQRVERVAQAGGAGAAGGRLAVLLEIHGHFHRCELAQRHPLVAQDIQRAGGVVGDGVGDRDVPAGDAGIDDLQRGDRIVDGRCRGGPVSRADRRVRADAGRETVHVGRQDERDLRLGLGRDQQTAVCLPAAGHQHVVKQHTEVGLIDTELILHHRRGQADLAPD